MVHRQVSTRGTVVSLLLLLLCVGTTRADDAVTVAAENAFPAPAVEHGFEFRCDIRQAGEVVSELTLSAEPFEVDGKPGWRVRDVITPKKKDGDRVRTEAYLDSRLDAVRGTYERRNTKGFLICHWQRGADGTFELQHRTQEYENQLFSKTKGRAKTSLAGLLLFLRLAPAGAADYGFLELDPDPTAGDAYVVGALLRVHRQAAWRVGERVHDAWIVSFTRGQRSYRIALATKNRDFLGLQVVGMPLLVSPAGGGAVGLQDAEADGLETPLEVAERRSAKMRAALPAPSEGFRFEADLVIGDYKIGSAVISAEPSSVKGQPAWLVRETTRREAGEAAVLSEWSGFLAQDLSLLRGESIHRAPSGNRSHTYTRTDDGIETVHHLKTGKAGPVWTAFRPGTTTGLVSVVLFLQALPDEEAVYVLPGYDPLYVRTPKAGSGAFPVDLVDAHVEVLGNTSFDRGLTTRPTWAARVTAKTGRVYVVHLDRATRALVAVEGVMPKVTLAPKGTGGKTIDWFEYAEKTPRNAHDVFVKFGRGYHLPREDLLADAFHWPTMLKHEIEAGSYEAGTKIERVRKDWIDEFVRRSKHRTVGDCDDLLMQIFMTATETTNEDGSVTIATIPAYGGHAYRCEQIDGRWYIVRVD